MTKKTSRREKGITHIALIVTIIVLLILAGVTIYLAVNNQGIFNKAKTETRAYNKNASENEQTGLDEADKENMPKEGGSITYTDSAGNTKPLTKDTPTSDYGTKIGNTTITNSDNEEIKLDWYLFDVSDDGKTAYLVSTPTNWEPDISKEVRGAYPPKLVSSTDSNKNAMTQAIQKLADGTSRYNQSSVTYTPSDKTWNYFKSVNPLWSAQRGNTAFASLNENEQAACYLADEDIFKGIKDQVNNANGNLKGKIQTLVGGASIEQWCKAYNKQSASKDQKITCEYSTNFAPGYIYKVNDKQSTVSNRDHNTGTNTIFGNDIYGAARKNDDSSNPFYSWWGLASPSAYGSYNVCSVDGSSSDLDDSYSNNFILGLSLLACVAL